MSDIPRVQSLPSIIQQTPVFMDGRVVTRYDASNAEDPLVVTYRKEVENLSKLHVCVMCGLQFNHLENLQRRNCWIHTGRFKFGYAGDVWSCCNKLGSSKGCVSSMHVESDEHYQIIRSENCLTAMRLDPKLIELGLVSVNTKMIENYTDKPPFPKYFDIRIVALYDY